MKRKISVTEAFEKLNDVNFEKPELVEDILTEAQLTVDKFQKSQFPQVPLQKLIKIVEVDPTYNAEKKVVGKYAKWLCNLAFKRNVDILKDANEYRDQLSRFNSIFNQLPQDKRDLQKVKNIEDLIDVNATVEDEKVDIGFLRDWYRVWNCGCVWVSGIGGGKEQRRFGRKGDGAQVGH